MSTIDGGVTAALTTRGSVGMDERVTWVRMMAETFEVMDEQRRSLVQQGPWTARTDNIARFSRFETYA